jgi:hypothetical protein
VGKAVGEVGLEDHAPPKTRLVAQQFRQAGFY